MTNQNDTEDDRAAMLAAMRAVLKHVATYEEHNVEVRRLRLGDLIREELKPWVSAKLDAEGK